MVSDQILKPILSVGNHDWGMNHTGITFGIFGDDLTSDEDCRKCQIYEINHTESPSYRTVFHLTIFGDHEMYWS